jgi:osmoprotectant transport system substrate-binding protein
MKMTKNRFRWRAPLLLLAMFSLALASCGSSSGSKKADGNSTGNSKAGAGQTIRLRPQDFAESKTLTEVYAMYLKSQGFETSVQKPDGAFRKGIYPALAGDKADLVIDYSGSAATELAPNGKPSPEAEATYTRLTSALKAKNLAASAYSKAEDKNALVVLKSFAEKNKLTKISDLKKVEDQVVFGGSAQCITRTDCLLGYQGSTYGLKFKGVKTLEYGPPLAAGLESGDIQAAQYQTTAPEIDSGKFVVLKDDKGLLSADNIVPIFRTKVSTPELTKALNTISEKLTTEALIKWNVSTDIDKEEPAAVAKKWLTDNNLL